MKKQYCRCWMYICLILGVFVFMGQTCELIPQEVIYVIGGYGWKARFIDTQGYVITDGVDGVNAQYNLANDVLGKDAEWVPYEPDQEPPGKPYNCGPCHTTGYANEGDPAATGYLGSDSCMASGCHGTLNPDIVAAYKEHGHRFKLNAVAGAPPEYPFSEVPNPPEGFVYGTTPDDPFSLVGIQGTWAEPNIGCEACHGPYGESGENHPFNPEDARDSCAKCHIRGDINEIDASGGLIKHHEQDEEWLASPHNSEEGPDCVTCHGPHASVIYDDIAEGTGRKVYRNEDCLACHEGKTIEFMENLFCIDCHMPYAAKSATKIELTDPDGQTVRVGDIRSHIWKINADAESPDDFFTDDGTLVRQDSEGKALGLTLNFACQQCHSEGGITPHGLPQATPYTFDQLKGFAESIHHEEE